MQIFVNGQAHTVERDATVSDLLRELNLSDRPVVTELNGRALSPGDCSSTTLPEGSRLEIVILAAGG